jgi:hypothetical protein
MSAAEAIKPSSRQFGMLTFEGISGWMIWTMDFLREYMAGGEHIKTKLPSI